MKLIKKYNTGGSTADRIAALRTSYNKTKRFDNKEKSDETKVEQPRKLTSTDVKVKSLRPGDIYTVKETTVSKYDPVGKVYATPETVREGIYAANVGRDLMTSLGQSRPSLNVEAVLNSPRANDVINADKQYLKDTGTNVGSIAASELAGAGLAKIASYIPGIIAKIPQATTATGKIVQAPARFVAKHPVEAITTAAPALMSFDDGEDTDWVTPAVWTAIGARALGRLFNPAVKAKVGPAIKKIKTPVGKVASSIGKVASGIGKGAKWTIKNYDLTGTLGYGGYQLYDWIADEKAESDYEDKLKERAKDYTPISYKDL